MIYTIGSQRAENVYYIRKTGGGAYTAAQITPAADVFYFWELNTARLQRHNSVSLVMIRATAMDGPGSPAFEYATPLAGTAGGIVLPAVASVAIKHASGLSGRSFRGRSYWIGLSTSHLSNADTIIQGSANTFAAIYNTLRTSLATAGHQLCVASLYSGVTIVNGYKRAVPRAQGVLTPISSSTCGTGIDTQRHRKAAQL